ncbi:Indoleamine 2,3-dioxygenase 1 [Choanephora cucurbitarum]|uniref:Indoleamine 2,3-dioxygenase 1 n=1 Tax=Choanephora cucurbitarum TaxID=101091 RepID=A0A1C7N7B6_9FUNG|nr:Indoleamine 2,3-dioxygenase 1 [Choanephora cucurbitarum]
MNNLQKLGSLGLIYAKRLGSKGLHRSSYRMFSLLTETQKNDMTHQMFTVGVDNGFLPRQDPLVELPEEFGRLESLLQRMPMQLLDGTPGLLASGQFGDAVRDELPLYDVDKITDQRLLSALFRDYTFAASAYLLEPCDILYRSRKDYGLGRKVLPMNIAVPLHKVSNKIHSKPFMEYALSYALYNYKKINPLEGLTYDNLALVRAFAGSESEKGFVLNHVTMVSYSPRLVKHTMGALQAAEQKDRARFNIEMAGLNETYESINREMEMMWSRSMPEDYIKFRTFIMGTKNQPMFPDGVIYEGVSDKPVVHRGESGANDSMVPLGDNLLQITELMPENPLTTVLRDFRSYRPTNHREFLEYVQDKAKRVGVKEFALQDANSAAAYLSNVDQIRAFRHRHWNFTKEYIIKHTAHPVATGGSPIVTWLPNQLGTVLNLLNEVGDCIDKSQLSESNLIRVEEINKRAQAQKRFLEREVATLKERFRDQERT